MGKEVDREAGTCLSLILNIFMIEVYSILIIVLNVLYSPMIHRCNLTTYITAITESHSKLAH